MKKIIILASLVTILSGCGQQNLTRTYQLYRVYHNPTEWRRASIICDENSERCTIGSDQKYFTADDQQNLEKYFCTNDASSSIKVQSSDCSNGQGGCGGFGSFNKDGKLIIYRQ